MPTKSESPCRVATAAESTAAADFLARDVDELVSEIKENLRLKSTRPRKPRPSPYSGGERPRRGDAPPPPEDPYEMLQQLLDSNSLVAEAVRRLTEGLCPKRRFLYEDDEDIQLMCPVPY